MTSIACVLHMARNLNFRAIRILLCSMAVLSSGLGVNSTEASSANLSQDSLETRIDTIFDEWHCPDTPGGAVAVMNNGQIVFVKGYGCADLEMSAPFSIHTSVYLASLSKQFVGYCVAKLILEQKLSLDDDIRTYLPEIHSFAHTIRVRDLIYHKSGLREMYGLIPLTGLEISDHLTDESVMSLVGKQKELEFQPGESYSYSNTNYFLLARIVERVTGEKITRWADSSVFAPLQMMHTHFIDSLGAIIPERAKSYHHNKDGSFSNDPFLDVTTGHTGLYSTIEDMSRWLLYLHKMDEEQAPILDIMRQSDTLNDGTPIDGYAFGFFKSTTNDVEYWHRGSLFGFKSIVCYYPGQKFGLVILGNVQNFNRIRYAREITKIYFPQWKYKEPVNHSGSHIADSLIDMTYKIDTGTLGSFTGSYVIDRETVYDVTEKQGRLFIREVPERVATRLYPAGKDRFRDEANSLLVLFEGNSGGGFSSMKFTTAYSEDIGKRSPEIGIADEKAFKGQYYSDELEIHVTIRKCDGRLEAYNARLGKIELYAVDRDEFRCNNDFFSKISMDRGKDGQVRGFLLDGFRVHNIRFVKK